jgi:hypothetical protein
MAPVINTAIEGLNSRGINAIIVGQNNFQDEPVLLG